MAACDGVSGMNLAPPRCACRPPARPARPTGPCKLACAAGSAASCRACIQGACSAEGGPAGSGIQSGLPTHVSPCPARSAQRGGGGAQASATGARSRIAHAIARLPAPPTRTAGRGGVLRRQPETKQGPAAGRPLLPARVPARPAALLTPSARSRLRPRLCRTAQRPASGLAGPAWGLPTPGAAAAMDALAAPGARPDEVLFLVCQALTSGPFGDLGAALAAAAADRGLLPARHDVHGAPAAAACSAALRLRRVGTQGCRLRAASHPQPPRAAVALHCMLPTSSTRAAS